MKTTSKHEQMWESLNDPEYRHQFVEEEINVGIAFQIRSLRNRQKLTQGKLAELLDIKQPLISEWENPSYGKYALGTLKDLAKAFDVGLLVRFVPFSTLVDWTISLTSDAIAPPSFGEEEKNRAIKAFSAPVLTSDVGVDKARLALGSFDYVSTTVVEPYRYGPTRQEEGVLVHA